MNKKKNEIETEIDNVYDEEVVIESNNIIDSKTNNEDKKSPEKWAKEVKIDPMLVIWWTNQGKQITKNEFIEILNKLQIKME